MERLPHQRFLADFFRSLNIDDEDMDVGHPLQPPSNFFDMDAGRRFQPPSHMFDMDAGPRFQPPFHLFDMLSQSPSHMFDKRRCLENLDTLRRDMTWEGFKSTTVHLNKSFSDPKACGPSAKLDDLKVITLEELVIGDVHRGRVLYGRLCARPVMLSAVHTVLEDESGNGVLLSIYNAVRSMASPEEVAEQFPVWLKVAIKEPYFKWALNGEAVLRVDNPANVIRIVNFQGNDAALHHGNDETKTVEWLEITRCEGNKLFRVENWIEATAKYSDCIDEAVCMGESSEGRSENLNNVLKLAYSNRAEAKLRLRNFEGALADAEKALQLDSAHLKSLARQGRAAMEIGLYEKACKAFEAALELSPQKSSIIQDLRESRKFLEQSRTGNHTIGSVPSLGNTREKYADYVGPVEIGRVSYAHGRRGLFAKEPIKANTLLLVNNAMATATKHPTDGRMTFDKFPRRFGSSLDETGTLSLGLDEGLDHDVVVQVVERTAASKRSMAQLYSLGSRGKENLEVPSMELFEPGSQWVPPSASTQEVDITLIKAILKVNAFGTEVFSCATSHASEDREDGQHEDDMPHGGLWVLPSFMNHSCAPNCFHRFCRNIMFVRATREIRAGEELTICYFPQLFAGLDTRQDEARSLHFACGCERCGVEKQLEPEFSEINSRIGVLVPASKLEFSGDLVGSMATAAGRSRAMSGSRKGNRGSVAVRKQDGAWAAFSGRSRVLVATTQLANFAERVETLIGSLEVKISAHHRCWIRAGFLEVYLAKYMLETLCEPDGIARIDTLNAIVESMISIIPIDATLMLAHLLFHDMKNKNGNVAKENKCLLLRAIRSYFGEMNSAKIWSCMKLMEPRFDYRKFSFDHEG